MMRRSSWLAVVQRSGPRWVRRTLESFLGNRTHPRLTVAMLPKSRGRTRSAWFRSRGEYSNRAIGWWVAKSGTPAIAVTSLVLTWVEGGVGLR
eukprot:1890374-Pyramimonas_sp.AAC.1